MVSNSVNGNSYSYTRNYDWRTDHSGFVDASSHERLESANLHNYDSSRRRESFSSSEPSRSLQSLSQQDRIPPPDVKALISAVAGPFEEDVAESKSLTTASLQQGPGTISDDKHGV